MKTLLNKTFATNKSSKPASKKPRPVHNSSQPVAKKTTKPRSIDPKMDLNVHAIKSILKPNDGAEEKTVKSVRIVESFPHTESRPISTPTKIPVESQGEDAGMFEYNASDLERGQFSLSPLSNEASESESMPLLASESNANADTNGQYQTLPPSQVESECWRIPMPDSSINQPSSSTPQLPFSSPLSRFLQSLYQRYPTVITYILVAICVAGALYSLITGKGSGYLWVMIKAGSCWILGTDIARMLFGIHYCDIDIRPVT